VKLPVGVFLLLNAGFVYGQVPTITSIIPSSAVSFGPDGAYRYEPLGVSCTPTFTRGMVVTVRGTNMGRGPVVVTVNDWRAPQTGTEYPLSEPDGQHQLTVVQIPMEVSPGPADVIVIRQGSRSQTVRIVIQEYAPCILRRVGSQVLAYTSATPFVNRDYASPIVPGQTLNVYAAGLGPTVPEPRTGEPLPKEAQTALLPIVRVNGRQVAVLSAHLMAGRLPIYEIRFQVPQDLEKEKEHRIAVSIGNGSAGASFTVTDPIPWISAVTNSGSLRGEFIAPGSFLTLFGANFGIRSTKTAYPEADFLSITVNGTPLTQSQVIFVSPEQINIVIGDIPINRTAKISVTSSFGVSKSYDIMTKGTFAGAFRVFDPSSNTRRKNLAAVRANTAWLAIPSSTAAALGIPTDCRKLNIEPQATCGEPTVPGEIATIYTTGLGRAASESGDSLPRGTDVAPVDASVLYRTVAVPRVSIAGQPAEVLFSGVVPGYWALYQLNVRIPENAAEGDEVTIRIDDDEGTIAIRR
jgi:uncharacterized protein (TIGR03437 family)